VVISKKVTKSAVKRNLGRRRVYEYIRPRINEFDTIRDVVIIITSCEILSIKNQELTYILDKLLKQSKIINKL
jgi:ribonuclease P protein component